ncbi:MAG TPA: hypothetical protein VGQ76_23430 [Thermoanaerobaculia bacterium]|jgi:hypothetical protein|nr:hypothetical protein [Thermoanaerobaculia bacterium]
MQFIEQTPADAPEFLARVEAVVARAVHAGPTSVYLIRIDHWFGERWVGFAGKVSGVAGVRFRENFVLPPFVPSRVVTQVCYRFTPKHRYVREQCTVLLHIDQPSSENFRRFVDLLLPASTLVWFSDKSAEVGRGSVMAYVQSGATHDAWYGDFAATRAWNARRLIGLTRRELQLPPESQPA